MEKRIGKCGNSKMIEDLKFYQGKKVLVTGHTGFKGSWLCKILKLLGAEIAGYSLKPSTMPSLFELANVENEVSHYIGDIRDFTYLQKIFDKEQPVVVFHLAAQPIVRESYKNPRDTYETNVMGTVNILECCRNSKSVISILNVTTDKVYLNQEWTWGYRENERLDGYDPYSNSKSCSELVTGCYNRSFLKENSKIQVSTARAGNVIGGGDFSSDRIIPDCIRAAIEHKEIVVRNPESVRPYQHVLEPLFAYLIIAARQVKMPELEGAYNVGPDERDCISTATLADLFVTYWKDGCRWTAKSDHGPHEANLLKLDCSKLKANLGWNQVWDVKEAIQRTVEWTKIWLAKEDISKCMEKQICDFIKGYGTEI